jgi:preprotein translocase subunit SecE
VVTWSPVQWVEESRAFLTDVSVEVKKVTWPSQKETVAGTISVIVLVTIIGLGLFVVDGGLSWFMSLLWS